MRERYVTGGTLASLLDMLSERDRAILGDLARVRVLTGGQLTRLHFAELSPDSRERTRRRVLARLTAHQLVATLDRSVGGARAGSAGHTHALGITGIRALPLLQPYGYTDVQQNRVRGPVTPGSLFLAHALDIAELYVRLVGASRTSMLVLTQFDAEPATWHPDGHGGHLKPDAYVRIRAGEIEDSYWIEVDKATESIPTLRRKLMAYLDFARSGHLGPDGITPRVLLTVPDDRRLAAVRDLVGTLPEPAGSMIATVSYGQAVVTMIDALRC